MSIQATLVRDTNYNINNLVNRIENLESHIEDLNYTTEELIEQFDIKITPEQMADYDAVILVNDYFIYDENLPIVTNYLYNQNHEKDLNCVLIKGSYQSLINKTETNKHYLSVLIIIYAYSQEHRDNQRQEYIYNIENVQVALQYQTKIVNLKPVFIDPSLSFTSKINISDFDDFEYILKFELKPNNFLTGKKLTTTDDFDNGYDLAMTYYLKYSPDDETPDITITLNKGDLDLLQAKLKNLLPIHTVLSALTLTEDNILIQKQDTNLEIKTIFNDNDLHPIYALFIKSIHLDGFDPIYLKFDIGGHLTEITEEEYESME